MKLKAQRAAAVKAAQEIIKKAQDESRALTEDEMSVVEAKQTEIANLTKSIEASEKSEALFKAVGDLGGSDESDDEQPSAKSLGDHFIKSLKGRSLRTPGTVSAPEFKASTDTQATGGATGNYKPFLVDTDTSFVLPYREQPVVSDLLASGTVSGSAIQYPVFGDLEGGTATVSEGGAKSQLHVADPTWVTDALSEIAGWFKLTDDMSEDLPFVVSEINTTALYDLALKEQTQLLTGDGTAPNLKGILNRTGVQTEAAASVAAAGDDNADAIFRAMMKVQTATGFAADGIAINPTDYQALRLRRDGNGQYFGGGFFAGQYGAGTLAWQPPIWGLKTVVTTAVTAGTVVVGAWKAGGKVLRKGGIRVESTNSHDTDFTNDKITVRVRERVGLQVKYPKAFVKVTLDDAAPPV